MSVPYVFVNREEPTDEYDIDAKKVNANFDAITTGEALDNNSIVNRHIAPQNITIDKLHPLTIDQLRFGIAGSVPTYADLEAIDPVKAGAGTSYIVEVDETDENAHNNLYQSNGNEWVFIVNLGFKTAGGNGKILTDDSDQVFAYIKDKLDTSGLHVDTLTHKIKLNDAINNDRTFTDNINVSGEIEASGLIKAKTGILTDTINENTTNTGVAVENVTIKDGKIGIGVDEPEVNLHIVGGEIWEFNNNARIVIGDNGITGNYSYVLWDSLNKYVNIGTDGANGIRVKGSSVSIGNIYPSQPLIVGMGTSEIFRVQNNGKVGINNTNPQHNLDINGDLRIKNSIIDDEANNMIIRPKNNQLNLWNTNWADLYAGNATFNGIVLSTNGILSDSINENTTNAGVTIEGILHKDNRITGLLNPIQNDEAATKGYVDQFAQGLDWQESVLDKDLTTPPTSPNIGDRYLILSGDTGTDWEGHNNEIAEWDGNVWQFTVPDKGTVVNIEDENKYYTYNGTDWILMANIFSHNQLADLQGGQSSEYYHLTQQEHDELIGGGITVLHKHPPTYLTDYVVSTEQELIDVLNVVGDYQSIGIKGIITLSDTINLPQRMGVKLIGFGGAIISPKNGHSLFVFPYKENIDWEIRGLTFRTYKGIYSIQSSDTILCITQDRTFTPNEFAGQKLLLSYGYPTPYYVFDIISNTENTITINGSVPNATPKIYWILPNYANQAMFRSGAVISVSFYNNTFDTHNGGIFYAPGNSQKTYMVFKNNLVTGRFRNYLFYGNYANSHFFANKVVIGNMSNESVIPLDYYFYLVGGWCIHNRIESNYFNSFGWTTPSQNVIYYRESSASRSSIFVNNNYFMCKNNSNPNIYLDSGGYAYRIRRIFGNEYAYEPFVQDYNGGTIKGEIAFNVKVRY